MQIKLCFPLTARTAIPSDHGYALLGAVSRIAPSVHHRDGIAVAPIAGRQAGERLMSLTKNSRLVIRVDASRITEFLPLAGKTIELAGRPLAVGAPVVQQFAPSATLRSRLVTIKGFFEPDEFAAAARRQLAELAVDAQIEVGKQRTLRIKGNEIVGFETRLSALDEAASLIVQEHGIGGRHHMGCGFFLPTTGESRGQEI